jgi:hypothetical protein
LEHQMIVVGHEHVGVDVRSKSFAHLW